MGKRRQGVSNEVPQRDDSVKMKTSAIEKAE
jgi:hypothetical protein